VRARGVRQHSDIDIAILPRDPLPIGFFGELDSEIEESTIPYDVDDLPSSRRRPGEGRDPGQKWIPAFAGITG
jgi:hypothetical protein